MTDPINLDALDALLAAGTPLPWRVESRACAPGDADDLEIIGSPPGGGEVVAVVEGIECAWGAEPATQYERDARLIAGAVNALPAHIREIRRLRAALARHGQHDGDCALAIWTRRGADYPKPACSCGLAAELEGR